VLKGGKQREIRAIRALRRCMYRRVRMMDRVTLCNYTDKETRSTRRKPLRVWWRDTRPGFFPCPFLPGQ